MSRKRKSINSDDSEDATNGTSSSLTANDTVSLTEETEESIIAPSDIDPIKMLALVKEFQEYVHNDNKKSTSVKAMNHVAEEFLKSSSSPQLDVHSFLKSFRKYLSAAVKQSNLSVFHGLACIDDYMSRPDFITTYPDYPRRLPNLAQYYAKKNNIHLSIGGPELKELKKKLAEDTEGRKCCEAELLEMEEKFLEKLEVFATNHPELNERQQISLSNKIKSTRKKLAGPQPPKTPNATPRKPAKKKKTAFDMYLATVTEKYPDLDEETRNAKLQKKYSKIPEEYKELFEKIAAAR